MSQENVEIVRRMLESFHAGDAQAALAFFSSDVVTDTSRSGRPDARNGRGREALAEIIGEWMAAWETWDEVVHEVRDLDDDRVMVDATQRGRGKGSGVEISTHYATIYELRRGEIASMSLFLNPAAALEAAGLSRERRA